MTLQDKEGAGLHVQHTHLCIKMINNKTKLIKTFILLKTVYPLIPRKLVIV